ncbi:unnamed protein product [Caenorhabditis nigoni]
MMANDSDYFARAAILEEYKLGTKIDEAFLKISDFLPQKIDREEFDYWFKKFQKGDEGLEYDSDEIARRFDRAPSTIRTFVLHDVLGKVDVFKGFERLSKIYGEDTVEYEDYEWWYYRFRSGKRDIDYDRSKDPKLANFGKIQNATLIFRRIMSELDDVKDRWSCRNVCTFWRTIMDAERITVDTASIQLEKESVEICLNNYKKKFTGVDFIKRAHRDWTTVLASLRLVRRFSVQINDSYEPFFDEKKKTIDALEVSITADDSEQAVDILEKFRDRTLRRLTITALNGEEFNRLYILDQFKHAQRAYIHNMGISRIQDIEQFTHCRSIGIKLPVFGDVEYERILEVMTENRNFIECALHFYLPYDRDQLAAQINAEIVDGFYIARIPIDHPDQVITTTVCRDVIYIRKNIMG